MRMASTGDHGGQIPGLSSVPSSREPHPSTVAPSDVFLTRSFSTHGSQHHLPTPNSPNPRIATLQQNPFESPSRPAVEEQKNIDTDSPSSLHMKLQRLRGHTQVETQYIDGLGKTSQMVTPESSPMRRDSADYERATRSLSGMHRSTPPTLAPAPIISPSSGRCTVQMLTDNLSPPGSPTPSTLRPEYMRRFKRSRTDSVSDNEDSLLLPRSDSLGITNSPSKGRVLKLFEPVDRTVRTPESHPCQSNSAFHYPFLLDPALTPRPKTPEISSERLQRIEKRLTAFSASSSSRSRLFPAEIPGRGRVLINSLTELDLFATLSPTPRRSNNKKAGRSKKGIVQALPPPIPSARDAEHLQEAIAATASWPDNEFPWSLHTEERLKRKDLLQQERLSKIRRFLEHDSDGEDEDKDSPPKVIRRRRPANDIQNQIVGGQRKKGVLDGTQTFSSVLHSADAKEALRASRWTLKTPLPTKPELTSTEQLEMEDDTVEEDDGILKCICGTQEDRPMVRCDSCKFWYHQDCMNIVNEEELEEEWFCSSCSDIPQPPPMREPTLVPTNEEHSVTKANPHLPLYQVDDLTSTGLNNTPRARAHGDNQRLSSFFQTPRAESSHTYRNVAYQSQSSSSNPNTPNRPSARSGSKIWATPSFFEDVTTTAAPDSPFDPTSTPSRGMKFGIPLISTATPKDFGTWSSRMGGLFTTPFQAGRSNQANDSGRRTFDLSDFTPGIPSWNNSPLALASGSAKGQILEFGGDLVIPQNTNASAAEASTSGRGGNVNGKGDVDDGTPSSTAQIHEEEKKK